MECAEMIAMRSDTYSLYEANPGGSLGWNVGTPTAPSYWSTMGAELEYCTLQDIEDAISPLGFTLNIAAFVQRVSLESVVPGDDESVVDTLVANAPSYHVRKRVTRRELVAVPDASGDYQIVSTSLPWYFRIAAERPMRHQVMTREYVAFPPFGVACDIVKIDTITGPIQDALCRQRDYFRATGTDKDCFWDGTLLAASGTTWSVIAVPWRDLMCDFSPDGSGPQSTIDTLENVPLVLPDNTARATWLSVAEGDVVDVETLAGSATPTWPDGHHTWELLILNRPVEEFSS